MITYNNKICFIKIRHSNFSFIHRFDAAPPPNLRFWIKNSASTAQQSEKTWIFSIASHISFKFWEKHCNDHLQRSIKFYQNPTTKNFRLSIVSTLDFGLL